jgi:hypothetical protein
MLILAPRALWADAVPDNVPSPSGADLVKGDTLQATGVIGQLTTGSTQGDRLSDSGNPPDTALDKSDSGTPTTGDIAPNSLYEPENIPETAIDENSSISTENPNSPTMDLIPTENELLANESDTQYQIVYVPSVTFPPLGALETTYAGEVNIPQSAGGGISTTTIATVPELKLSSGTSAIALVGCAVLMIRERRKIPRA